MHTNLCACVDVLAPPRKKKNIMPQKTIAQLRSDLTLISIESRQIGAKAVMSPADSERIDKLHKEYKSIQDEITVQEIRPQRPPRASINNQSEDQNTKGKSLPSVSTSSLARCRRRTVIISRCRRRSVLWGNNSPSTNPTSGAGVLIPIGMDDQINHAVKAYGEVANAVRTYTTDTGEGIRLADAGILPLSSWL